MTHPLRSAGRVLFIVSLITVSWNGVRLGPAATLSDVIMVLAVVAFVLDRGHERSEGWSGALPAWLVLSAALFLLIGFISTLIGGGRERDILIAGRLVVAMFGVPLLTLAALDREVHLRWAAAAFVASGAISVAVGVILLAASSSVIAPTSNLPTRLVGLATHPNHLGVVCAMSLPLGLGVVVTTPRRVLKAAATIATAFLFIGVLGSGSRAAGVTAIITVGGFVFLSKRRVLMPIGVTSTVLIVLLTVGVVAFNVGGALTATVDRLLGGAGAALSDAERAGYLRETVYALRKHPLLGAGFVSIRSAHNVYVQVLHGAGVLGVVALALLVFGAVYTGWWTLTVTHHQSTVHDLAAAATMGFVGWMAAGLVQNLIYDRYIYVPLGFVIAAGWIHRASSARRVRSVGLEA